MFVFAPAATGGMYETSFAAAPTNETYNCWLASADALADIPLRACTVGYYNGTKVSYRMYDRA